MNDFKIIDSIWRYNGRGRTYINRILSSLEDIENIFDYDMIDINDWTEKLNAFGNNLATMKKLV